jgi:4-amino-4-deoxy-L-arabinose transferase-like glycosyltransferase
VSARSRELFLVLLLLVVSWGVQFFVLATRRIPTNSDQAIVGLMAKHILDGKGHPVFYYGSSYAGSLEAHFVALFFAIFGPSPGIYRFAMVLLVTLTMLGVYAVARRCFGCRAALFSVGYLAVPPFFFLYKGLTSDGHYNSFNLFTVLAVGTALRIDADLANGRRRLLLFIVLGVVLGLGWWINPITPAVSLAVLLWLYFRKAPRPSPATLVLLLGGVVVGGSPWWIWNARHAWASLKAPELGTVGVRAAIHNLGGFFTTSLPTLAGGMEPNTLAPFARETLPYSRLLSLVALSLVLAPSIVRAVRGDRCRGLLLLVLAGLLLAASFSQRSVVSEPRFLLPFYVVVPPLVGAALAGLLERRRQKPLWVACAVLLCLHAVNLSRARVSFRNVDNEVTGRLDSLIRHSKRAGIRSLYADYWTSYRVSFESQETIVATPIPGEELVRFAPYNDAVGRDTSAGFALLPPRSGCFESYLRERDLRFSHLDADGFRVFYSLPDSVLDFVRSHGVLPLPTEAYRVAWEIREHPTILPASGQANARVAFQNTSPCAWPQAVHLGYHWKPLETGLPVIFDGGRELPNRRIAPGERVELDISLKVPAPPGRYLIEYDLVFELVEWFSTRGAATAQVRVAIQP